MTCSHVSILVITGGRDDHLLRQQDALNTQAGWDHAVVGFMNQQAEPWDNLPERVRTIHIQNAEPDHPSHNPNLSAARNSVAFEAMHPAALGEGKGEGATTSAKEKNASTREGANPAKHVLIFLDVDCIPDEHTISTLAQLCQPGRVVMSDPHYLPPDWSGTSQPDLNAVAMPHPSRAHLHPGESGEWHMLWAMGFAITAEDFVSVGGFDESYEGFGGEDTDFALRCRDAGLHLWLSDARVFHQPHPVYRPPLQHLRSIVINAQRFKERWGSWPMEAWLNQFQTHGYVHWDEDRLDIVRLPTGAEVAAARVEKAAFG